MLIPAVVTAILITSCFSHREKSLTDIPKSTFEEKLESMSDEEVNAAYIRICQNLIQEKNKLAKAYESTETKTQRETVLAKARELFALTLSDSIFVCWYGTGWDFNGTTTCPRNGNIACGYFITTVLQQSGFNIRREFLAQQASSVMIKTFCSDDQIKIITDNQTQKLFAYMKTKPDGVFVVGLDNHTGFIFKKGDTVDFIDADYRVDKVLREPLEKSTIIKNNRYFMVGDLLHSDETMVRWLKGEKIGNE